MHRERMLHLAEHFGLDVASLTKLDYKTLQHQMYSTAVQIHTKEALYIIQDRINECRETYREMKKYVSNKANKRSDRKWLKNEAKDLENTMEVLDISEERLLRYREELKKTGHAEIRFFDVLHTEDAEDELQELMDEIEERGMKKK